MKKQFNILVLCATVSFMGCRSNDRPRNVASESAQGTNVSDNNAFEHIIVRDSVVVLKYKAQTDTITFPIVNPKFPALAKSLHPETILGERLYSIKKNYENCGCGYISLSYQKAFSNSKIISLWFHAIFVGPYPSETIIYQTLNISTGKPYKLTDQLTQAGQEYVLAKYKDTLLKRLEEDNPNRTENEYQDAYQQIKDSITQLTFDRVNDNYIVENNSLNVKTEPILPHAILASEINRNVDFSLDELKTFKKSGASI